MATATLHETHDGCKPTEHAPIPATTPPHWVDAGAEAKRILARLQKKARTERRRCRHLRRLAERHMTDPYDPALSDLIDKLLTAEEALKP